MDEYRRDCPRRRIEGCFEYSWVIIGLGRRHLARVRISILTVNSDFFFLFCFLESLQQQRQVQNQITSSRHKHRQISRRRVVVTIGASTTTLANSAAVKVARINGRTGSEYMRLTKHEQCPKLTRSYSGAQAFVCA